MVLHAQELRYQVYFETDKTEIPDSALIELIHIVHRERISRVLIEGHCDSVGSRAYNLDLSKRRALEVRKLLAQNGIADKYIKTCIGFGKDKPLNENRNDRERQLNRRALIRFFIDEDYKKPVTTQTQTKEIKESQEEKPKPYVLVDGDSIDKKVLAKGRSLVFENLLFEPGRHILREESLPVLRKVFDLLDENPSLELEIQGHVCCTSVETDGHDWDTGLDNLSLARAKVIYEYLVSNGIEKIRLEYKGYGGAYKIHKDESTEENRRVNRRVAFKVINF